MSERKKEIILVITFVLSMTASFALGYLYAREYETIPIIVEQVERNLD